MIVSLDKVPQSHWTHEAAVTAVADPLPALVTLLVPTGFWKRSIYLQFSTDGFSQTGTLIGELRFLLNGQVVTTEPLQNKQINNQPQRMFMNSQTSAGPEFIKYRLLNGTTEIDMFPHEYIVECDKIQLAWFSASGVAAQRGQYFIGCLSQRNW